MHGRENKENEKCTWVVSRVYRNLKPTRRLLNRAIIRNIRSGVVPWTMLDPSARRGARLLQLAVLSCGGRPGCGHGRVASGRVLT